jgi:hypothetical protein
LKQGATEHCAIDDDCTGSKLRCCGRLRRRESQSDGSKRLYRCIGLPLDFYSLRMLTIACQGAALAITFAPSRPLVLSLNM